MDNAPTQAMLWKYTLMLEQIRFQLPAHESFLFSLVKTQVLFFVYFYQLGNRNAIVYLLVGVNAHERTPCLLLYYIESVVTIRYTHILINYLDNTGLTAINVLRLS